MAVDELRLRDYRPRSMLRVPVHDVRRPRFPVVDAHNHLASPSGRRVGDPLVGRAPGPARRVGRRDPRRPRRRAGRPTRRRDRALADALPDRVVVFAGLDYDRWATDDAFGETEAAALRDSVDARSPRAQGLEAARAASPRSERPSGRGRRSAGSIRCGRRPLTWRCPSSSTSPIRSRSSSRSTRRTSAGRSFAKTRTGTSGRRDRPDRPDAAGFPAVRRAARRVRAAGRRPSADDVHRRPRRLRGGGSRRSSAGSSTRTRTSTSTSPRGSASSAASRIRRGPSSFATPDRILFGVGSRRPTPTCTRSTTASSRRSTSRSTTATGVVPDQGRWQIHGIGLPDDVLRKVYSRQRPPPAAAGARVTGSGGYAIGARRGLEACASPRGTFTVLALDHRQNLRKELRPDGPGLGHVRGDGRVQARRGPDPRAARDRDAARSGDRGGPVHRGRLAAAVGRPDRRDRGDRLRRAVDRTGQPRPRRLERREGEADGRLGREAARLLPPGRAERRGPGATRRRRRRRLPGRTTSRCSSSRCRSRSSTATR